MNLIKELGPLALGTRLKRLSDTIMKEGSQIYADHQIPFEPKWFPVVYLLHQNDSQGITEIAQSLGFTHPAISQFVTELEKQGWVRSVKDKKDQRKRLISLTEKAKQQIPEMIPLWHDINLAIQEMISSHHHNILLAVEELEADLDMKSLHERVAQISKNRQMDEVEIIDYVHQYQEDFKNLNYEWIEKYFEIEEIDRELLENPEEKIINNDGFIVFARYKGKIIGTCALIKDEEGTFELAKMAVTEKARGKQAGKKLGQAILKKAKENNIKTVTLLSNTKLTPAINLYKKLGFKAVELNHSQTPYLRTNIKMQVDLD